MKRGLEPKKALKIGLSSRQKILRFILIQTEYDYINNILRDSEDFINGVIEVYNNSVEDVDTDSHIPLEDPEDLGKDNDGNETIYWPSSDEYEWLKAKMSAFTEKYRKMAEEDMELLDKS